MKRLILFLSVFIFIVIMASAQGCIHEITKPDGTVIKVEVDPVGTVNVINAIDNATTHILDAKD